MNTPKIKLEAGFFFGQKSAFNKWLKELTDSEQDLVIDMLVEFSQEKTEQIEAQNARLLEALKVIESYDEGNGCCPYGCDCPTIAETAISEAESTAPTP